MLKYVGNRPFSPDKRHTPKAPTPTLLPQPPPNHPPTPSDDPL